MFRKSWFAIGLGLYLLMALVEAAPANAGLPEFSRTGVALTGEAASVSLETAGSLTVKCKTSVLHAEINGAKTLGGYTETYKSCLSGTTSCLSSGAIEGEVKTRSLTGELGYLSATKHEVGIRSESSEGKSAPAAEFSCGSLKVAVKGAVIGSILPVNSEVTHLELARKGEKGAQSIKKFEGGLEEVLQGVVFGESFACSLSSVYGVGASRAVSINA